MTDAPFSEFGPTRAGYRLTTILGEMRDRGERVPPYFRAKMHRYFLDIGEVENARLSPRLRTRVLQLIYEAMRETLRAGNTPAKLRTHGGAVVAARYRSALRPGEAAAGGEKR